MKKNGMISYEIVFGLGITIMALMIFLLNDYVGIRQNLSEIVYPIKDTEPQSDTRDINLYIYKNTLEHPDNFEPVDEVPQIGYYLDRSLSKCDNGSTMEYVKDDDSNKMVIKIYTNERDVCYAYFREAKPDINVRIFVNENFNETGSLAKYEEWNEIPNRNYNFTSISCDSMTSAKVNEVIKWVDPINNEIRGHFEISTDKPLSCKAYFTKKEADIILNYYIQDENGSLAFEGVNYRRVSSSRDTEGYVYNKRECNNNDNIIKFNYNAGSKKFEIEATGKVDCNVYFKKGA